MAIRIFANVWTEQQVGDILYIKDPIDEALANVSLSAPVESRNYHATMSLANRPDRMFLVKVMRGNLTNAEWDQIDSIHGVRMMPPYRFDLPIMQVPQAVRTTIQTKLTALGIPKEVYNGAATVGGFWRSLLKYLDAQHDGFGEIELETAEWE